MARMIPDLEKIKHKPSVVLELLETVVQAIDNSGLDISPCRSCGSPVLCVPDGLALCKCCAEEVGA